MRAQITCSPRKQRKAFVHARCARKVKRPGHQLYIRLHTLISYYSFSLFLSPLSLYLFFRAITHLCRDSAKVGNGSCSCVKVSAAGCRRRSDGAAAGRPPVLSPTSRLSLSLSLILSPAHSLSDSFVGCSLCTARSMPDEARLADACAHNASRYKRR